MKLTNQIEGFEGYMWKREINVRDFIQQNYTPYEGDGSFLAGPTSRTNDLWDEVKDLMKKVFRTVPLACLTHRN